MTTAKPKRRWLLIGSLALNLFLIGFMAVGALRHHWHDEERTPRPFREMIYFMQDRGPEERFLHHFSDADDAVLKDLKAKRSADLASAWADARAARTAVQDLMRQGVRNPDILRPALENAQAARKKASDQMDGLTLDLAERLSDEGYTWLAGEPRKKP